MKPLDHRDRSVRTAHIRRQHLNGFRIKHRRILEHKNHKKTQSFQLVRLFGTHRLSSVQWHNSANIPILDQAILEQPIVGWRFWPSTTEALLRGNFRLAVRVI